MTEQINFSLVTPIHQIRGLRDSNNIDMLNNSVELINECLEKEMTLNGQLINEIRELRNVQYPIIREIEQLQITIRTNVIGSTSYNTNNVRLEGLIISRDGLINIITRLRLSKAKQQHRIIFLKTEKEFIENKIRNLEREMGAEFDAIVGPSFGSPVDGVERSPSMGSYGVLPMRPLADRILDFDNV